jgi:hypothetical protein
MAGHKSATMTLDLYRQLLPGRWDEVADALDSAARAAAETVPLRSRASGLDLDVKRRNAAAPMIAGL